MPLTFTFAVDAIAPPEPITAQSVCRRITVREDVSVAGWPTVQFNIRAPLPASPPVCFETGESKTFIADGFYFRPGQIIGYIETVAGASLFCQAEE